MPAPRWGPPRALPRLPPRTPRSKRRWRRRPPRKRRSRARRPRPKSPDRPRAITGMPAVSGHFLLEFTIAAMKPLSLYLLAGLLAAGAASAQAPQLDLAHARLTVGMHQIDVQVAQTHEQRMTG